MIPRVISTRAELLDVIRDRRDELSLTHQTIDAIGGLSDGYTSKLLAPVPIKNFGEMSLGTMLDALALGVAVVAIAEDPEQAKRMAARWQKRKRPNYLLPPAVRCSRVAPLTLSPKQRRPTMKMEQIQVRLEPELRDKLQAEADRDRRSLAAMARILLQDAIATRSAQQRGEVAA
jgi:hypothetical protein